MKRNIKSILLTALCMVALCGCQKGDGDAEYGNAYVYMPQATLSAGIDNYYRVPSGDGEYTYNFKVTDSKVDVLLGVTRSGKLANENFSVDVQILDTQTADAVTQLGASAMVMPASIYTRPSTVSIDSYESSFALSIDKAALKSAAYDGKTLVVCVGIANPTRYELAKTGTSVTVIVDVDALGAFI